MPRTSVVLSIIVALALCARATAQPASDAATENFLKGLGDAVKKIQQLFPPYFNRVHADELAVAAVGGLLEDLDPSGNSFVVAKDKLPAGDRAMPQVRIRMHQGAPVVASVVVHSEASLHDIRQGDVVLRVDGDAALGKPVLELEAKLAGAAGSTVKVGTFRMRDNTYREATLKREPVEAQVHARRITGKIGYVQVNLIDQKSVADYETKLKTMLGEGLTGLILDLRNTSGGTVEMAVRLADPFLPGQDKVVAKVQDASGVKSLSATPKTTHVKIPIVVLQNLGTQGAAEIAAAALQENHRAILLGENTFGAGIYDAPKELTGNLMVQLATTYVQTPSGKELMGKGVAPDIIEPLDAVPAKQYKQFREEFLAFCKGTPPPKPSDKSAASTGPTTGTTSTAATGPTTGAPADEDDEDESPKDDKKDAKPSDQVLGEYQSVRKFDNTLMRAVNLLISTNIFYEQMLQR